MLKANPTLSILRHHLSKVILSGLNETMSENAQHSSLAFSRHSKILVPLKTKRKMSNSIYFISKFLILVYFHFIFIFLFLHVLFPQNKKRKIKLCISSENELRIYNKRNLTYMLLKFYSKFQTHTYQIILEQTVMEEQENKVK